MDASKSEVARYQKNQGRIYSIIMHRNLAGYFMHKSRLSFKFKRQYADETFCPAQ